MMTFKTCLRSSATTVMSFRSSKEVAVLAEKEELVTPAIGRLKQMTGTSDAQVTSARRFTVFGALDVQKAISLAFA